MKIDLDAEWSFICDQLEDGQTQRAFYLGAVYVLANIEKALAMDEKECEELFQHASEVLGIPQEN